MSKSKRRNYCNLSPVLPVSLYKDFPHYKVMTAILESFVYMVIAHSRSHIFTHLLTNVSTKGDKNVKVFPRAHTCFNRIDMPIYKSKAEMQKYLTLAINMESTGFDIE